MTKRLKATFLAVPAWVLAILGSQAWAQPAKPAPRADANHAEAEVRAHAARGDAHFDKQEWREALEEYTKLLALRKTKGAMFNVASCLRQLGRYDEALDQYEELRREFPALPRKMDAQVALAMAELEERVGTLVVAGDVPDGAALFVDDRWRGLLPLPRP